jgi:hypothetical protein
LPPSHGVSLFVTEGDTCSQFVGGFPSHGLVHVEQKMKHVVAKLARTLGVFAFVSGVMTVGTGCGAITAAANPKVAWALNDPAPMSVVVRRADVAEKTAQEVDRIMTDTPVGDNAAWLGKVGPQKDEATQMLAEVRQHQLYAPGSVGQASRVVAAEVWAKSLAQVEPKAPRSLNSDSKTPSAVAKNEERTDKKASKKSPTPPAAAPETAVPSSATTVTAKASSLLAAIDKDLGAAWAEIMEKKKSIGALKAQIAALEATNDAKETNEADKKANKKTIASLETQESQLEKEADKLADAFVPKAKAAASKASPEVRETFGAVLVNLRQAIDDAKISNGAAALRYPLATTTTVDSVKAMVAVYVADVIEEKTGKRPSTQGLQPGVTTEGGKVAVTLNGLTASDMGKLSVSELTTEVSARTTRWFGHAMGLLGSISATKATLAFEDDVLGALVDGFKASGFTPPAPATIPEAPAPGAAATPRS